MPKNLKPCPSCGVQIAKSARTCPHCGKTFTSAVGIITAIIIGLIVGWFIIGRTCSSAASADRQIDEIREQLQRTR